MTFLIQQTLLYAVPLMIVALAGVFAERSGIINLALEGIMIFGAFVGVLFVNIMQGIALFHDAFAAKSWLTLQGLELLAMLAAAAMGRGIFLVAVLCLGEPEGGPDHRRHGPEPDGSGPGALSHPYHCQPKHPGNGGWQRCRQLVYD